MVTQPFGMHISCRFCSFCGKSMPSSGIPHPRSRPRSRYECQHQAAIHMGFPASTVVPPNQHPVSYWIYRRDLFREEVIIPTFLVTAATSSGRSSSTVAQPVQSHSVDGITVAMKGRDRVTTSLRTFSLGKRFALPIAGSRWTGAMGGLYEHV